MEPDRRTIHFPECHYMLNFFDLLSSKFLLLSLQFNFLWSVANSIQIHLLLIYCSYCKMHKFLCDLVIINMWTYCKKNILLGTFWQVWKLKWFSKSVYILKFTTKIRVQILPPGFRRPPHVAENARAHTFSCMRIYQCCCFFVCFLLNHLLESHSCLCIFILQWCKNNGEGE